MLIDVFGAGALVAVFPFATAAASRSRQSEAFSFLSFSCNAFGLAIESSSRQSEAPLSEDETSASRVSRSGSPPRKLVSGK
jgi:hypothetical protein